jgi:putative transposase
VIEDVMHDTSRVNVLALCVALGLARSTFYRRRKSVQGAAAKSRAPSPRALTPEERQEALEVLHSDRFVDRSPAEVVYTLLEEDQRYICSPRTMYRLLAANREIRERRNQLRHPAYTKPELMATRPNQVWSWDITKLKGEQKWVYYYLFVILDIYSRYVVAWMVAEHENAELAMRIINEAYDKQGVQPDTLVLHSDRGSPMKAKTTAQLLGELGVDASFSRPRVSNDNPYSESHFKTCKYHPGFPNRFGSIEDALSNCWLLFPWYNNEHRHSGLAYLTPYQVHYGLAEEALDRQHRAKLAAYHAHPERFVAGPPKRGMLPEAVWINPPAKSSTSSGVGQPVTPDETQAQPTAAMNHVGDLSGKEGLQILLH